MNRRHFCKTALAAGAAAALPGSVLSASYQTMMQALSDVPATTVAGEEAVLEQAAVDELRQSLRGSLLTPGSSAYDTARTLWNGMIDKHPALIARCAGASDVAHAVNFARERDLLVAVKGGGHSFSGKSSCDGGMMIDLSGMDSVRIDPNGKTGRVEPGVLGGSFDREAQTYGLMTPMGTVSHTGASGLTLGGGFGRTSRLHGLACDNLVSVDIVTADGRFLHASEDENADLFWGIRGGGGNFGVVTSFEYRLHRAGPMMIGGAVLYPMTGARDAMDFYVEYVSKAPRELLVDPYMMAGPGGNPAFGFEVCYCGSHRVGEKVLEPLMKFGKPIENHIGVKSYFELQTGDDEALRHGQRNYIKSGFIAGISAGLIEDMIDNYEGHPSMWIFIMHNGGAISDVAQDATAFAHRGAMGNLLVGATWQDPAEDEANIARIRAYWKEVSDHVGGYYVNLDNEDLKGVPANYGSNYKRLVELKNKYDPTNLFRLNSNIKPSA